MREVALFVEDYAHQQVIGALARRMAQDHGIDARLDWRNARHGHGAVAREFKEYLRDLQRQGAPEPDVIIVATDANCKGFNDRAKEFQDSAASRQLILAIPDPHIERWLLLDGAAFKVVFGQGCDVPDQKCSRDRYKELLITAILNTGIAPTLGGIEFAEDLVAHMDIGRAARVDPSFKRFVDRLTRIFQGWRR